MATVMLDAGHGGYDNGASFEGRKEKDDNLNLVLAIGNILENNGVDVLYTRTTDIYQSPNEKANIANRSDASYFVSIHRNSSPQPNTYSGVQTLVYADAGIPALFAVLRGTKMPAALVEVGFINTEQDNRLLDLKFPETAQAIADGILQTVQGANIESSEVETYSLELGVFMHEKNAQNLAKTLQEEGYESYIEVVNNCYRVGHGRFTNRMEAKKKRDELFARDYEVRIIVTNAMPS